MGPECGESPAPSQSVSRDLASSYRPASQSLWLGPQILNRLLRLGPPARQPQDRQRQNPKARPHQRCPEVILARSACNPPPTASVQYFVTHIARVHAAAQENTACSAVCGMAAVTPATIRARSVEDAGWGHLGWLWDGSGNDVGSTCWTCHRRVHTVITPSWHYRGATPSPSPRHHPVLATSSPPVTADASTPFPGPLAHVKPAMAGPLSCRNPGGLITLTAPSGSWDQSPRLSVRQPDRIALEYSCSPGQPATPSRWSRTGCW